MLTAEIIAIGSELLTPEKTDTNSLWLTGKLNDIGVDVKLKTIVGDDSARLEEVIADAVKRSDIIITTGGLGPTEDDITRLCSANAIGRKLIYHNEIETHLRERFKGWGREMPEINKRQAYIIEGAGVLPNPNGSAVGMLAKIDEKFLIILPGPPRENQPMFNNYVFAKLREKAGDVFVNRRLLRVTGYGESAVDEKIAPIYTAYENLETSILFSRSEIEVHLAARADSDREASATVDEVTEKIVGRLGDAVFSTNGETMEQVLGDLLTRAGKTIAVAESCTGGLISRRLTEVSGSSKYFLEGVVSYSNQAKMRLLSVPGETIDSHGAVSAQTAEAMAKGMREAAGSDIALSVTGIAGPDGGSEEKPVGTVFIGYSDKAGERSIRQLFPGDRYLIRWRSSQAALDLVRRRLLAVK
jgi:competence/damage-inducible protein CinA C-terminal domain